MGCDVGASFEHSFRFAKMINNTIGSGKLFTASYTIVSLKGIITSNRLVFVDPPPLATEQVSTDDTTRLDEDPTHLDDAERADNRGMRVGEAEQVTIDDRTTTDDSLHLEYITLHAL